MIEKKNIIEFFTVIGIRNSVNSSGITFYFKENDFKELIRRREVYTVMEVATDKCEDVANVIETIIVKYA